MAPRKSIGKGTAQDVRLGEKRRTTKGLLRMEHESSTDKTEVIGVAINGKCPQLR